MNWLCAKKAEGRHVYELRTNHGRRCRRMKHDAIDVILAGNVGSGPESIRGTSCLKAVSSWSIIEFDLYHEWASIAAHNSLLNYVCS